MGRRGEIYWADLNSVKGKQQGGYRPVLAISQDIFNEKSGTVIAMAITSKGPRAGFPLTLKLKGAESLKHSWMKISQIRTLSTERLGEKIGMASPQGTQRRNWGIDGYYRVKGL